LFLILTLIFNFNTDLDSFFGLVESNLSKNFLLENYFLRCRVEEAVEEDEPLVGDFEDVGHEVVDGHVEVEDRGNHRDLKKKIVFKKWAKRSKSF
jgi:hypothetical protein